jgi:hypothetical protein
MPSEHGDVRQPARAGGLLGGLGETATQAGHDDVQGLGGAEPVLLPHLCHQRFARDGGAGVPGKQGEGRSNSFGRSGASLSRRVQRRDVVSMTRSPSRSGGCGCDVMVWRRRWARRRASRTVRLKGLTQVVVGACVQADDDVDVVGAGGEDHDQQVGEAGAQGAGEVQSVEVGHRGPGERRRMRCGPSLPGPRRRCGSKGGVAIDAQAGFQVASDGVVVLDDQDVQATAVRCGRRAHGNRVDRSVPCTRANRSRSSSTAGHRAPRMPFRGCDQYGDQGGESGHAGHRQSGGRWVEHAGKYLDQHLRQRPSDDGTPGQGACGRQEGLGEDHAAQLACACAEDGGDGEGPAAFGEPEGEDQSPGSGGQQDREGSSMRVSPARSREVRLVPTVPRV